ncbi:alpha/beta hydrolase family protein [Zhouia sp. PK063]|uniref:alpha/beta hydrolase family protein n=1 Tax=Zhouia sp. PK063 TaxID=3373602 RepID=UPI00378DFBA0
MKQPYLMLLFCAMCLPAFAQKKALTVNDFASWKQISSMQLSENGNYLVYEYNPEMGDGALIITNLKTKVSDTIARGYNAKISGNSTFVAFQIKPQIALRRVAETAKYKKDKQPKDSIGIYVFENKSLTKYESASALQIPSKAGSWLAYKIVKSAVKDTAAVVVKDSSTVAKKKPVKAKKDTLVVAYNPITKDSIAFKHIKDFSWAVKKNDLLLTYKEKDSAKTYQGLLYFDADTKKTDSIYREEGDIEKATLNQQATQIAFLVSTDTTKIKSYALFEGTKEKLQHIKKSAITGIPENWEPSKNGNIYFSEKGNRLFFGTAYQEIEHKKDTLLNNERASLDVWSWTDKDLQPAQKLSATRDQKKTYLAVYDTDAQKAIQLGDSLYPNITVLDKGDGKYVLASNNDAYERATSWSGLWISDYTLINLKTGEKKSILKGQNRGWIGPAQKMAVYFNRKDSIYYSINLQTLKETPLTHNLGVVFYDEQHDTPSEPGPYGIAGWGENDETVYVYDRYDIWKIDVAEKQKPVRVTKSGRENHTSYRYIKLDTDEKVLNTKNALLYTFNEKTKASGFSQTNLERSRTPKTVLYGDVMYGYPDKARNAATIVFTKQDFTTYPDVYVTTTKFKSPQKITNAGEQVNKFKFGTVSLEEWTAYDGTKLQGLLYKPENYDPNKKYPMISYFYELNSDTYHRFYSPAPSRSTISKSFYTSNDYFVFVPDIVYKTGHPGKSAYNCIVSGVDAMVKKYSAIDASRLALQGQSWGGYQTAYLITQTNKFAAAMAGAPVSNMTSAYGGIRWGTGMSRMFQYEHTQSRIGGTLWNKLDLYLENSPLFYADKVKTPLLMMHNDADTAVPWYQGIEYFTALRRLDKPVWMLSYNGEPHNLNGSSWGDRMDLSIRMKQFFDHYLKDAPAPQWMIKGRPAVEKSWNKGY